jgi:hypothetical protein
MTNPPRGSSLQPTGLRSFTLRYRLCSVLFLASDRSRHVPHALVTRRSGSVPAPRGGYIGVGRACAVCPAPRACSRLKVKRMSGRARPASPVPRRRRVRAGPVEVVMSCALIAYSVFDSIR